MFFFFCFFFFFFVCLFGLFLFVFCDLLFMNRHCDCSRSHLCQTPWVWYSHNIPPMIKMLNQNMTQRETQTTSLGVIISKCSPDNQHGKPNRHLTNVDCSFFRYTNDDLRNHTNQRRKHKTWTKEGGQLALHCYFRNNPT